MISRGLAAVLTARSHRASERPVKAKTVLLLGLLTTGCASSFSHQPTESSEAMTFQAGGLGYPQSFFVEQLENLKTQAAFDLDCDGEALTMEQLKTNALTPIGVAGCGKKATYIWNAQVGWVMNSASGKG